MPDTMRKLAQAERRIPLGTSKSPYDPEADGWVVLVEPLDVDRGITEIWDAETTLADLLWEHMSIRPKPGRSVATGSTSRKTSSMPLATPFTRSSTDARWSLSTPSQ
jgi:hypothetical protein